MRKTAASAIKIHGNRSAKTGISREKQGRIICLFTHFSRNRWFSCENALFTKSAPEKGYFRHYIRIVPGAVPETGATAFGGGPSQEFDRRAAEICDGVDGASRHHTDQRRLAEGTPPPRRRIFLIDGRRCACTGRRSRLKAATPVMESTVRHHHHARKSGATAYRWSAACVPPPPATWVATTTTGGAKSAFLPPKGRPMAAQIRHHHHSVIHTIHFCTT